MHETQYPHPEPRFRVHNDQHPEYQALCQKHCGQVDFICCDDDEDDDSPWILLVDGGNEPITDYVVHEDEIPGLPGDIGFIPMKPMPKQTPIHRTI